MLKPHIKLKNQDPLIKSSLTAGEVASVSTDPHFYGSLDFLPNPDEVLRRIGKRDTAYMSISQDPHVAGEMRSARAGLLKFETKIMQGGDSADDILAFELCQQVFNTQPAPNMTWQDVLWNMNKAQYYGYVVHEIIWRFDGTYLLPKKIIDRRGGRFRFNAKGELLVLSANDLIGTQADENRILLTRHQPNSQNPYGVALFSSCFWSYTFKTTGFRSYTKFINKYGLPWAVGKYPQGTSPKERDELVESLAQMVEDAVAAVPDGNAVELIEAGSSKSAPQESFINLCNREMSKALTSQTMATEQSNNGSRAAGQVAREREESVDTSNRTIIEATMNKLFTLITRANIPNATPPVFKFYEQDKAPIQWVETLEKAITIMPVSKAYAHKVTGIPAPINDDDILIMSNPVMPQFAQTKITPTDDEFNKLQEQNLDKIYSELSTAKDLNEFAKSLDNINLENGPKEALQTSFLDAFLKGRKND